MSFTANRTELWKLYLKGGEGKKREISVSKLYCAFGSLSWCLWVKRVRKRVNLPSWDQALSPSLKGMGNRDRRWDFSGRWLGKSYRKQTQLDFFSEPTGIIVFLNTVNRDAELLLGMRVFSLLLHACNYVRQIFLWSYTAMLVFICSTVVVLNHSS